MMNEKCKVCWKTFYRTVADPDPHRSALILVGWMKLDPDTVPGSSVTNFQYNSVTLLHKLREISQDGVPYDGIVIKLPEPYVRIRCYGTKLQNGTVPYISHGCCGTKLQNGTVPYLTFRMLILPKKLYNRTTVKREIYNLLKCSMKRWG